MDEKPEMITIAGDSQCTISATEKSGGTLAPYFASRVSEAMSNLEEISECTVVNEIQHVPGNLNPADIPTRRGQTDRGYKKPDTNTDIRTPQFVSDNRNRIIEIAIR